MKEYKFIPALSAGYLYEGITRNREFLDGSKMDFYNYDDEYRYPYFLITAGHFYKKDQYEQSSFFKKPDTTIFGDSGGFQIAKGTIKWDLSIRDNIFNWLEKNSTIAANLDIPVASKIFNYDECLEISKNNFKYFHDKQSGSTKFLNVLQGHNLNSYKAWYSQIKEFTDFAGWCVGNSGSSIANLIDSLLTLIISGEHKRMQYLHYLGASGIPHMVLLAHIQNGFNKLGVDVQVYSDSSSPNSSRFGYYYYDVDFKTLAWRNLHIPYIRTDDKEELAAKSKNFVEIYDRTVEHTLPHGSKFDKERFFKLFTSEDMVAYNGRFCSALILHNTMTFVEVARKINEYARFPEYYRMSIFNDSIAKLGTFVEDLIIHSDSVDYCMQLYNKNFQLIQKFKNVTSDKYSSKHAFF